MSDQKLSAKARVTITVEIDVGAAWGEDCSVAQVHKQGATEAVNRLRGLIQGDRSMHIVGEPRVAAIIAEKG